MRSPLSKLPKNSKIAVIGSGVSGLMFTYFLGKLRPDVNIRVFELQKRSGGWINSWETKDQDGKPIMLEKGPRTLRGVSDGTVLIIDTLKDLNQEKIVRYVEKNSEANRKFLLDTNDALVQVPSSLGSFLKFMINPLSKGLISGILGEWFRKAPSQRKRDESVSSFISRRFGNEYVGKNVLSAIFHGIYADDINKMSVARTLSELYALEKNYGSIFKGVWEKQKNKKKDPVEELPLSDSLSQYQELFGKQKDSIVKLSNELKRYPMLGFKGGLEAFPILVRNAIDKMDNVEVMTGEEVLEIIHDKPSDAVSVVVKGGKTFAGLAHVRVTSNPSKMSQLVKSENEELSRGLDVVKSNTVLLVNYFLPGKDVVEKEHHGFGYLVPQSNKNPQKLLGVIFDSIIEKNFKPFLGENVEQAGLQADYTKLTIMLGGHLLNMEGEHSAPSKDVVIRAVKEALGTHLSISKEDLDRGLWQYTVAEKCLPHFFVGYNDWQADVENQFLNTYAGRVSMGGMGFSKGPGVPDVIVDALQDAIKLH